MKGGGSLGLTKTELENVGRRSVRVAALPAPAYTNAMFLISLLAIWCFWFGLGVVYIEFVSTSTEANAERVLRDYLQNGGLR